MPATPTTSSPARSWLRCRVGVKFLLEYDVELGLCGVLWFFVVVVVVSQTGQIKTAFVAVTKNYLFTTLCNSHKIIRTRQYEFKVGLF